MLATDLLDLRFFLFGTGEDVAPFARALRAHPAILNSEGAGRALRALLARGAQRF